jgi:CDP-diglyceride synthetase
VDDNTTEPGTNQERAADGIRILGAERVGGPTPRDTSGVRRDLTWAEGADEAPAAPQGVSTGSSGPDDTGGWMTASDSTLSGLLASESPAGRSGRTSSTPTGGSTTNGEASDGASPWAPSKKAERRGEDRSTAAAAGRTDPIAIDSFAEPDQAWTTFTPAGPRWRDEARDWAEVDAEDHSLLGDDQTRVGTLDPDRVDPSTAYSFDELEDVSAANRTSADAAGSYRARAGGAGRQSVDGKVVDGKVAGKADRKASEPMTSANDDMAAFEDELDAAVDDDSDAAISTSPAALAATSGSTGSGSTASAGGEKRRGRTGGSKAGPASGTAEDTPRRRTSADSVERPRQRPAASTAATARPASVGTRVVTGVALAAAAGLIVFLGREAGAAILAIAVVTVAALEFLTALRQRGFRPAILLALPAVAALVATGYRTTAAREIPALLVLITLATCLWYVFGVERDRPVVNMGVTVLVIVYLGVLGMSATSMLRAPEGLSIFVMVLIGVVAHDVFAYFVGRQFGRMPLAPEISPNKSVEGLVAGVIGAIIVTMVGGTVFDVQPFDGLLELGLLGLVVGLIAPVGDLFESLLKRDLGIKDMGTTLPGHGGVLDRIDAMLLALPAAFLLGRILGWL